MTDNPDNKRKIGERDEIPDVPSPSSTHEDRRRKLENDVFGVVEKLVLEKLMDGLTEVTLDRSQQGSLEDTILLIKQMTPRK